MLTAYDAFISFSHHDAGWVRDWLLPRLETAGLSVCVDYRDFDIGIPSLTNMENAIERSSKTLLVITPDWIESEWTRFESLLTQTPDPSGVRQRTLPLLLKQCKLPRRLEIFTYADFTNEKQVDQELSRLVSTLSGKLNARPPTNKSLQPNLVHPYPLQVNFTGRVRERAQLTAWLKDQLHPICELIALGGMGKSALSWYWLTRDVLPSAETDLDGVIWWSFYEGESSFAGFIDEALQYVSSQPGLVEQLPTTYDRAQELRKLVRDRRVLFVLDGFERQLRAYGGIDAPYRRDDASIRAVEARTCIEPGASGLLRHLASGATQAKMLITTRMPVSALEDLVGNPLDGVLEITLEELLPEDAIDFMRAQGVRKGTHQEIDSVCAGYGYHALSLRLLSGLIARDAKMPGDIAATPRHKIHENLIQRQHHVLEQSYNALPEQERALLSRLAAFRSSMSYEALGTFNDFDAEAKFESSLEELRVRGLLQRDLTTNRYDLHPIVRHYAYDRLTDKKGVHTHLRNYFARIPAPEGNSVQRIEDLAPVLELFHHTIRSGRFEKAQELFRNRLADVLYFRFGAYQSEIELLRAFFPAGDERPPRVKDQDNAGWLLNELANLYGLTGRPDDAVRLTEKAMEIAEERGKLRNLSVGLLNLAADQLSLGKLRDCESSLLRSISLCRQLMDQSGEGTGLYELARVLTYMGETKEATKHFRQAVEAKRHHAQASGNIWAYQAIGALMNGAGPAALIASQQVAACAKKSMNEGYPVERDLVRGEWLLGASSVMAGTALTEAHTHLTRAVAGCRRLNLVEIEPDILLAWARWHYLRNDLRSARKYCDEALGIANRSAYRLKQAEIHIFKAKLAIHEQEPGRARAEAQIARERAWCDGPPYCYKPALIEAEKMLKELAEPDKS